jgi:hypothetical protein
MSRVEAATGLDRLPWLPDEPVHHPERRRRVGVTGVALATVLLVGGTAFWFGTTSVEEETLPAPASTRATSTVRLPAARPAAPVQPETALAPIPEVEPIVAPPTPVIEPPPVTRAPPKTVATPREPVESPSRAAEPVKSTDAALPQPWPVRVIDGAAGRLVRIGAFSSVHQAKRGWWAIVRASPALTRLPALVVPVRSLHNGRRYYRLQMGTTSQAHSAVLCQRMRMTGQPCVIIGAAGDK